MSLKQSEKRTLDYRHQLLLRRILASGQLRQSAIESKQIPLARELELLGLIGIDRRTKTYHQSSKGNIFLCNALTVPREFAVSWNVHDIIWESKLRITAKEVDLFSIVVEV